MITDLIQPCCHNHVVFLSLTDIFKVMDFSNSLKYDHSESSNIYNELSILKTFDVKAHFIPELELVLSTLIEHITSEKNILNHIYLRDLTSLDMKVKSLNSIIQFLEFLLKLNKCSHFSQSLIISFISRCNFAILACSVILKLFELAEDEIWRSFQCYSGFVKCSQPRDELIGGIIYFLFVLCFETFSSGLYEFLRVSVESLVIMLEYEFSGSLWLPEINILKTILALCSHSDQKASTGLIQFVVFDQADIKPIFKNIIVKSLKIDYTDSVLIVEKIIQTFGNSGFASEFKFMQDIFYMPDN